MRRAWRTILLGLALGIAVSAAPACLAGSPTTAQLQPVSDPQLREQAHAGDATAQILLGLVYSEGRGVTRDITRARYWFTEATEQGDMRAAFLLGVSYLDHEPTELKLAVAERWIKYAARGGNSTAQRFMALSYEKGWMDVKVNREHADYWWQRYHRSQQQ